MRINRVTTFFGQPMVLFLLVILISGCNKTTSQPLPTREVMSPGDILFTPTLSKSSLKQFSTPTSTVVAFPLITAESLIEEKNEPQNFSESSASKTKPSDVLKEITFFGTGGGPRCDTGTPSEDGLIIAASPFDGELLNASVIMVCGWIAGEKIEITVEYPNGQKTKKLLEATDVDGSNIPGIHFWFIPQLSDPEGEYSFLLEGNRQSLSFHATYEAPQGPHLYPLFVGSEKTWWEALEPTLITPGSNHVFLHGFAPKEKVRLLAYRLADITYDFYAWQEFQVDANGQTIIKLDIEADDFVAIGKKIWCGSFITI